MIFTEKRQMDERSVATREYSANCLCRRNHGANWNMVNRYHRIYLEGYIRLEEIVSSFENHLVKGPNAFDSWTSKTLSTAALT